MSDMANNDAIEAIGQRAKAAANSDRPLTAVLLLEQLREQTTLTSPQNYLLADSLRLVGRQREALVLFEQLERANVPNEKRWYMPFGIGMIYLSIGEIAKAEAAFRKAAELEPTSTVPWVYLGTTISKSERFDDAIAAFRCGLKAQGDLDEVYLNLGLSLRTVGQFEEAREAFRSALALDPDYDAAKAALADVESAIAIKK